MNDHIEDSGTIWKTRVNPESQEMDEGSEYRKEEAG